MKMVSVWARYYNDLRGFLCYLVYNPPLEGGQSYVMVTHGSGRRVRSLSSAVFKVSLEFLPHPVQSSAKCFFAVITPNSAHFAGNHNAALDMQDFRPLFTLYSTLQLCATLCRHFADTLITFCKNTPLKPFNCTILHKVAKCKTPLCNTQPLIYKGFNIYMQSLQSVCFFCIFIEVNINRFFYTSDT